MGTVVRGDVVAPSDVLMPAPTAPADKEKPAETPAPPKAN